MSAVSENVKSFVFERDGGACVYCGSTVDLERIPHHALFRSQYNGVMYNGSQKIILNDQHQPWNLYTICRNCHFLVHHGKSEEGRIIRNFFVKLAKKMHLMQKGIDRKWRYQPVYGQIP